MSNMFAKPDVAMCLSLRYTNKTLIGCNYISKVAKLHRLYPANVDGDRRRKYMIAAHTIKKFLSCVQQYDKISTVISSFTTSPQSVDCCQLVRCITRRRPPNRNILFILFINQCIYNRENTSKNEVKHKKHSNMHLR